MYGTYSTFSLTVEAASRQCSSFSMMGVTMVYVVGSARVDVSQGETRHNGVYRIRWRDRLKYATYGFYDFYLLFCLRTC